MCVGISIQWKVVGDQLFPEENGRGSLLLPMQGDGLSCIKQEEADKGFFYSSMKYIVNQTQ